MTKISYQLLSVGFLLLWIPVQASAQSGTWRSTGSMSEARDQHTATLLTDGRVLVAGGGSEVYDPDSGTWSRTGNMTTGHFWHTATLLADGRVLVAGGWACCQDLANAEVYDPDSGTWSRTGNMTTARFLHTATLLADGRVLVAGGFGRLSAEVYDPDSGTWSRTGSMTTRGGYTYTATLLDDGRVLVVGGQPDLPASAEIYDPKSATWNRTGSMTTIRDTYSTSYYRYTATLLTNGCVLVVGGRGNACGLAGGAPEIASAEIYNPESGTWSATGSLQIGRSNHSATQLNDGRVLVAGGINLIDRYFKEIICIEIDYHSTNTAELYTP